VSDKLVDFVSHMLVIVDKSIIVSKDVWDRADPSSIVNQFDELLADFKDLNTNLDGICGAA
jgi:hypothetical protein